MYRECLETSVHSVRLLWLVASGLISTLVAEPWLVPFLWCVSSSVPFLGSRQELSSMLGSGSLPSLWEAEISVHCHVARISVWSEASTKGVGAGNNPSYSVARQLRSWAS